jgi:hypothetical protein
MMRRKFANCWMENKDPIDGLTDCPSNMEIGLCWYQNGTFHLMVD